MAVVRSVSALVAILAANLAAAQSTAPPPVITGAAADASGTTITITGYNFGPRVFVVLELVPLPVQIAGDSQIVASAPVHEMPPGEYLLTVSRGSSPTESGSFVLKFGNVPPKSSAKPDSTRLPDSAVPQAAGGEPAVRIGDRVITVAEIEKEWQRIDPAGHLRVQRDLHDGRRRIADKMIEDELLSREAAARGVTVDALLKEEIPKRLVPLPDSSVTAFYQALGDGVRGAPLEVMRPAIRAWLERNTEPELARMSYIEELKKISTRADNLLAAPRVDVHLSADDPALGPPNAPIEIVAFGDFHSADYAKLAQAYAKVRETFGDRVRVVFKTLPARGPDSIAAAVAARCAAAQGRFWPYHDAMLTRSGPPGERTKESAQAAGLNRAAFDRCVERDDVRAAVWQSLDEASGYGIQKSPSFLINGRLAPDAAPFLPPFEFFKRLVEDELVRGSRR